MIGHYSHCEVDFVLSFEIKRDLLDVSRYNNGKLNVNKCLTEKHKWCHELSVAFFV